MGWLAKNWFLDDEVHPLVLGVQADVVADRGVASLATGESLKSWLGVVDVHDTVVEEPLEDSAIISSVDGSDRTSWESRHRLGE